MIWRIKYQIGQIAAIFLFLGWIFFISRSASASMTIAGPVVASSVTVSGDISISSMTLSTLTIVNQATGVPLTFDRILQVRTASGGMQSIASTTSWVAVTGASQTITLSNLNNRIRISLSGSLRAGSTSHPAYISIFRDSSNLGDSNSGLVTNQGGVSLMKPVGITIVDYPGDTNSHLFQVYMRSFSASSFPIFSDGYLLLEEVGQ